MEILPGSKAWPIQEESGIPAWFRIEQRARIGIRKEDVEDLRQLTGVYPEILHIFYGKALAISPEDS
jgi:hypothetical protein